MEYICLDDQSLFIVAKCQLNVYGMSLDCHNVSAKCGWLFVEQWQAIHISTVKSILVNYNHLILWS